MIADICISIEDADFFDFCISIEDAALRSAIVALADPIAAVPAQNTKAISDRCISLKISYLY